MSWLLHPALLRLLLQRVIGSARRLTASLLDRRRLGLWLLAAFWLAQAVICLLLRSPAGPHRVEQWLLAGLSGYLLWHFGAAAAKRQLNPYRWTQAEAAWLHTSPLRRRDLIAYRVLTRLPAAAAKSLLLCVALVRDLPSPVAALLGTALAFLLLDVLRMTTESVLSGLSAVGRLRYRTVVFTALAMLAVAAAIRSTSTQAATSGGALSMTGLDHGWRWLVALGAIQRDTVAGAVTSAPWVMFAALITSSAWSLATLLSLLGCVGLLASGIASLLAADAWSARHQQVLQVRCQRPPLQWHWRWARGWTSSPGSWGGVAWMQALGAVHYGGTLSAGLVLTAMLAWLPLLSSSRGPQLFLEVVAGLVLYTFVLLPALLKFDFRRNTERLAILKRLPIQPLGVTAGQLAVPVTLALAFQAVVLAGAMLWGGFSPRLLAGALVMLAPLNLLIFATENCVHLLLPHWHNQQAELLLRTLLTFTAKTLVLLLSAVFLASWLVVSREAAQRAGVPGGAGWLFASGTWLFIAWTAWLMTRRLAVAFEECEPDTA